MPIARDDGPQGGGSKARPKRDRRLRITDKWLKSQANSTCSKGSVFSDKNCPGLRVRVGQSGRKIFYLRYTYKGRKMCIVLGEFPAIGVDEARLLAWSYRAMLAKGVNPKEEIRRCQDALTFYDFCLRYYVTDITERLKSYKCYIKILERDLYGEFGGRLLTAITSGDIILYLQRIKKRASGPTSNRHLATISGAMSHAVKLGLLEKNPARGIQRYRESSGRERYLSDEELKGFMTELQNSSATVAANALQLLVVTGLRKMEVLSLPWSSVDLAGGYIKLSMDVTKGGRARTVVLNEIAVKILKRQMEFRVEGNPYVFPGLKPGRHLVDVRKTFIAATERAGITGFRIHDIRHTYCSRLANANVAVQTISKLVGHRTLKTTERYCHLSDQSLRAATSIMTKGFDPGLFSD